MLNRKELTTVMDKKINVLIFPAGSESALDIYESLRYNVNVRVFGASGKSDNSEYTYPAEQFVLGDYYVDKPDFYDKLNELIAKWSIDVVIPTHDTIALELSKNSAKLAAMVLVSEYRTADICRYKSKTLELFRDCDFCPRFFSVSEEINTGEYPVFIKPDVGAGGKGSRLIRSREEFDGIDERQYVICEHLPGSEYTIDCFTSKAGDLKFCGLRIRERIQMGIAFRSTALPMTEEVRHAAEEINKRLRFLGAWYFQMKADKNGKLKLMEISCRQSGTMTLYRHKGINFPLLGIYELFGKGTDIIENRFELTVDRYLKGCFKTDLRYDTVYIDFDDTVTTEGKVNIQTISFLYQCLNRGKRIVLLTRHKDNIRDSLRRYKIDENMFDEITDVPVEKKKSEYITEKEAVFIDNSFAERLDVFNNCGIAVFDADQVDTLIEKTL